MSVLTEPPPKWRPRARIRPRASRASGFFEGEGENEPTQASNYAVIGGNARPHGPLEGETGLDGVQTRTSLKLFFEPVVVCAEATPSASAPVHRPTTSAAARKPRIGVSKAAAAARRKNLTLCDNPPSQQSLATEEAEPQTRRPPSSAALLSDPQQRPAAFVHSASPLPRDRPIPAEYVLDMSKKSKRLPKAGHNGSLSGKDIMDSLVSSIDNIDYTQMRGLCHAAPATSSGHGRKRSETFGSVTSISPAPVIQTSKSSTKSPSAPTGQKLQRRLSGKRGSGGSSSRDSNGARSNLRSSSSQEHWLPPIEQEDDVFSLPDTSFSSNSSTRLPPIPARSSSVTHDLYPPQFTPRSNSLMNAVPPPISVRPSNPRRSENYSEIPPYITRYLRERTESKENLAVPNSPASPISPRSPWRSGSKMTPGRTRNSTTVVPGANDSLTKLNKLVTKRQSSQGFDRDLSATRAYYSVPAQNGTRRSASLQPSRSSLASDGSLPYSHGNYVHEVLNNPKLTQRIRLSSGRILSFSEVGDEGGWPVFCFTGMGLNRLVAAFYDEIASSFGLRIITPDRPGIGLSDEIRPSPKKVLAWADDVLEICQALSIDQFSLLGHSLGATYALAVSLRIPERVRGRVHLLAPWIPLSQVNAATAMFDDIAMDSSCMSFPATHRFLRVLPVPIIKVAGSFLKEKEYDGKSNGMASPREVRRSTTLPASSRTRSMNSTLTGDFTAKEDSETSSGSGQENDLVAAIWAAATRDSNAVVDLLTSLERPHTVGFTYFDVSLPVMIRHGSKDDRVPLERVAWMTKAMNMARPNNAELKVIQGAQHGLMARADVMSDVFEEIARESHKWDGCNRCKKGGACWLASNFKDAPPVPGKEKVRR